jgi:glyoxylase-like metal-dependent hydrolase (beta-lactamase superfamily II)
MDRCVYTVAMQVTPVRLAYNTAYIVDGPGWRVLIDTGPDYKGAWEAIEAALGRRQPDLVVATHGHIDHAGLGARWQRAGVPVALGAADGTLAAGRHLAPEDELRAFERYAIGAGTPPEVLATVVVGLRQRQAWARTASSEGYPDAGRNSHWPTGLRYESFAPVRPLRESGPLDGTSLEVVLCPGHTPGNLVVVERAEGWLFSGDQLLPDITPTPGIQFAGGERFRSLPAFARSLEALRGLGFGRCFPGHGAPFDGATAAIDANLAQIAQRRDRVGQVAEAESTASVYQLAERLYPRALERRYWQIMATVQGHVDLLDADVTRLPEG